MAITHKFTSAKSDSADATLINPSNWNATHNAPAVCVTLRGTNFTGTFAAALTEQTQGNNYVRVRYDLTYVTSIRLWLNIAGVFDPALEFRLQYSADNGTTWNYLNSVAAGTGPSIVVGGMTSPANVASAYVTNIDAAAKADVILRMVSINGTATGSATLAGYGFQVL